MNDIMGSMDIVFPNLGLYLKNVPKEFSIFGFDIALYGIFIGIGVLCGVFMAEYVAKKDKFNADIIWDFIIYAVVFSIIGARLFYVVFEWDMYKDNILEIFNLRQGGLAIYGGVIAAFLTAYIYCKIKKISFFQFVDICVPGLALGQAIGRWGNFTNREVFGGYSDGLFAMRLPVEAVRSRDITAELAAHIVEGTNYIQVHPTFLYESIWNIALVGIMLLYRRHKKFNGEMWLLYLGGYGLGRFWIEGIRTDQLYLIGTKIPVSQIIAITCVIVSIAADAVIRFRLGRKED